MKVSLLSALSPRPPSMATVELPEALPEAPSLSSVRRLRLKAVVDVSDDGSNVDAKGARKGAAAADDCDDVDDEEVDCEDAAGDQEASVEREEGSAAADAAAIDDDVKGKAEAGKADVCGSDLRADEESDGEAVEEVKDGTRGSADLASNALGSGAFASDALPSALPSARALSSTRRLLAAFLASSSASSSPSSICAPLLTGGRASDLMGVMAPPVPPNSFRVGSKRPRREARPGVLEADDEEEEGSAREEMMGEGDGSCRRFCDSSGVRSREARMRCAVWDDDSGCEGGEGPLAMGRWDRGPSFRSAATCAFFHGDGASEAGEGPSAWGSEPTGLSFLTRFLPTSAAPRGVVSDREGDGGTAAARGLGATAVTSSDG